MSKQRRQAVGMWAHDVANDEWDPWDGSVRASGCALIANGHGGLVTTPHPLHEVHEGHTFRWSLTSADDAPVDDNASAGLFFSTCNKNLHLTFEAFGGGAAEIHLHEAVAACTDGTAGSLINMNRSASGVSTVIGTTCPTIDPEDLGTELGSVFIPGGIGSKSGGGGREDATEWILSASQTYLLLAYNRGGSSHALSIVAQWYEEDPE